MTLIKIFLVAAAYFITANLSLLIAIPPGFATPLWPAAGIALASILIGGYRLLPGVLLGSFATNAFVALQNDISEITSPSVITAIFIATGAMLQAALGTFLIRRAVSANPSLNKASELVSLLFYGGAIACLLNALIGPLSLYFSGLLKPEHFTLSLFTWWVGDVIGVALFTPTLMLILKPRISFMRKVIVSVPILLFTSIAILMFLNIQQNQQSKRQSTLDITSQKIVTDFIKEAEVYLSLMTSNERFIVSSEEVTADEFKTFTSKAFQEHTGVTGMGWIPKVTHDQRKAHEASMHAQGFSDFAIKRRSKIGEMIISEPRDYYFPISYVEPYSVNKGAHGLDVYGIDPVVGTLRIKALDQARDEARPYATGRFPIVQAENQYGFIVYHPVYKEDAADLNISERRENLMGYVNGIFLLPSMMQTMMKLASSEGLDIVAYDYNAPPTQRILYDSRTKDFKEPLKPIALAEFTLTSIKPIEFAGRDWEIHFIQKPHLASQNYSWELWYLLIGSLLFSATFGIFTIIISADTEDIAKEVAREGEEHKSSAFRFFVPVIISSVILILSIAMWQQFKGQERAYILSNLEKELKAVALRISTEMEKSTTALMRMARRWEVKGGTPKKEWYSDAEHYVEDFTALTTVEWIDSNYQVRWVEPLEGNDKAVGLNILFNEERQKALQGAAERKATTLTQPLDLVQGYRAVLSYAPIHVAGTFDGFIAGIHDTESLFSDLATSEAMKLLNLSITDENNVVYEKSSDVEYFDEWMRTTEIEILDRVWHVSVWPTKSFITDQRALLPEITLLGGALFSLLVGFSVYISILSNQRSKLLRSKTQALADTNAELEEFAYRTSHDLRSPLVSSIGILDVAKKQIEGGNANNALSGIAIIRRSLSKLDTLVNDILELTRTKNVNEEDVYLDINMLVDEAVEKLTHMENFDRLEIRKHLLADDFVETKETRLRMIVENLLSNAIKYQDLSETHSYIEINTYIRENTLIFSIEDNGLGIPKDQQNELFNMFKRFHPKTSYGSGLGLYMIKKSTSIIGAQIIFEDTGNGTRFTVKIPLK